MQSELEKAFIQNIAQCLGRSEPLKSKPTRDVVGPPAFWKEQEHFQDQTLEMFKRNLEGLTGRVTVAKSAAEVHRQLREWLDELQAKSILCWNHPQLRAIGQTDDLEREIYYWDKDQDPQKLRNWAAKADVGLTWIDYAIGYTGTMATLSGPSQGRLVNLLPPTNLAVCTTAQLVPTMSQAIRKLGELRDQEGLPGTITFVTGPSRTSDIEMDLSIGVHGPYRTWVVILDQEH